ncbi:hypothetical protein GGR56DRAFT_429370 [Xylariaceae sp. FL0804]|nr:hypothetical protein GGR56DRAFT_429370 [Xylariaceae sp. FL0804]
MHGWLWRRTVLGGWGALLPSIACSLLYAEAQRRLHDGSAITYLLTHQLTYGCLRAMARGLCGGVDGLTPERFRERLSNASKAGAGRFPRPHIGPQLAVAYSGFYGRAVREQLGNTPAWPADHQKDHVPDCTVR